MTEGEQISRGGIGGRALGEFDGIMEVSELTEFFWEGLEAGIVRDG